MMRENDGNQVKEVINMIDGLVIKLTFNYHRLLNWKVEVLE
jgi:hypothetical protein